MKHKNTGMTRRELIKTLGLTGGAALFASLGGRRVFGQVPPPEPEPPEFYATSPRLLEPFRDPLPIPRAMTPSYDYADWKDPDGNPAPPYFYNDSGPDQYYQRYQFPSYYYRLQLRTAPHSFTSSLVRKKNLVLVNGLPQWDGTYSNVHLPDSWMSLFNGQFPGPMIQAWYGRPACVRIENLMDHNHETYKYFGVPSFLTHLHNGHTSCESDGNPYDNKYGYDSWHLRSSGPAGYHWCCDNLYLNWPAGGDDREKQSFLWFHDHRMDHTSSNVAKGMVGLYTLYDPGVDANNENIGLRLPSGKFDIPIALYDCRFDDGLTPHAGIERQLGSTTNLLSKQDSLPHPENWGNLFFAKYPGHGYVGDVYTVNGKAYPVLHVQRRKYRFRFLDCSLARWYELSFVQGNLVDGAPYGEQWMLTGAQRCLKMTQIATDGGLLPGPIHNRTRFMLAPAKRKEVVIDFSKYEDGTPTTNGDVIYLADTLQWDNGIGSPADGRKPNDRHPAGTAMPLMKIVIGDGSPMREDRSRIPQVLRPRATPPPNWASMGLPQRHFDLDRTNGKWSINGQLFDPDTPSTINPVEGSAELWSFSTSGGWVHPLHLHEEEHFVVQRTDGDRFYNEHPDDHGQEDVIALAEGETVTIYRKFRSFKGPFVSHCHNLAHEDDSMMFKWMIT